MLDQWRVLGGFPFLMPDLDLPGIGFGVPLFKQGDAKDFPISMGGWTYRGYLGG